MDGSKIPKRLSNPHGNASTGGEKGFSKLSDGVLGCFLSHILVLRDHLRLCPHCDLMVFEDDTVFHPNFRELWTEFIRAVPEEVPVRVDGKARRVPVAKLHFGGDAFWEPPLFTAKSYYHIKAASRTWGYVMKADAITGMMAYLLKRDDEANPAIDTVMVDREFVENFPVLAPKQPLLIGAGKSSTTGLASFADADRGVQEVSDKDWKHHCWSPTYVRNQTCVDATEQERP